MVPASLSLLLAAVPAPARPRAIGTWAAVGALGAALGPVIGGALVQVDWRWVFWINLPVGLAAALLALRIVPESKDEQSHGRPDVIGAVLLAASVGLVAYALVEAPTWGWASAGFLGVLAAALASGAAMVWRSHRHHSPVIELQLLRHRTFSGAFAASILYYAGFGASCSTRWSSSPGLALLRGAGRAGHRARATDGAAVRPCGRTPAGRLAGRPRPGRGARLPGERRRPGALAEPDPGPPGVPDPPAARPAARRRGSRARIPTLLSAGSASLTPARFGTGSGILNMARQVGTVLGVAGLIAVLAHVTPADPLAAFRHGLWLIIVFFAAAAVIAAGLLTRRAATR